MSESDLKHRFRKAYSEYYPLVFSILHNKVNIQEDAEDICHEVFIRFYNNFESIESPKAWLRKTIHFEVSNFYQKKGNIQKDSVNLNGVAHDENLGYENGFRDARIILSEAMENEKNFENEQEQILFDLITIYKFTYKEAGKYLNISKWQAQYTYKKIEARIISYLKDKGIQEVEDMV